MAEDPPKRRRRPAAIDTEEIEVEELPGVAEAVEELTEPHKRPPPPPKRSIPGPRKPPPRPPTPPSASPQRTVAVGAAAPPPIGAFDRADEQTQPEGSLPPSSPGVIPSISASATALYELCTAQLAGEADPERRARLSYELGRLSELEGNPGAATTHYQHTLAQAPDDVAAIRAQRRVLAALGQHAAIPALFDAEVAVTRDAGSRARLLCAKAALLEEQLAQPAAALRVLEEALALDGTRVPTLKAIERSHRRDGSWPQLADTYARLANAVSDVSLRAAWTAARAHLVETRMGDAATALGLYEQAVEADPHATGAIAHVKRLAAAERRWPQLVVALRKEHGLCADPDTRRSLLSSIARVQEDRLGDLGAAVTTLEEALAASPRDPHLLEELARLHGRQGRPLEEAETLARLVEYRRDPAEAAAMCHRIGRLHDVDRGDADRARRWYERALEVVPSHRASGLALGALLEQREDWTGLLRVLTARAAAITDAPEQAELWHRMGELLEHRMGRPQDATSRHAQALSLDPTHEEAFLSLTRLLAAAQRWRELAEVYERQIERAPHDAEAIAWLFRLGAVYEDRLESASGALTAYERVLARDAQNLGALHAIQRAAARAERWERLIAALEAEAQLTADTERKHALLHRAHTLTAERLGDSASAMRGLEGILAADPAHRRSLESLARLRTAAGRWDEVVGVYERLLPLVVEVEERAELRYLVGEIHERSRGRSGDAIVSYRRALELSPGHVAAREALHRALEATGQHDALAAALEDELSRITDPDRQASKATALGALHEDRRGDPRAALAAYERALAARPLHRPALDARERLMTQAATFSELANALSQEASITEDAYLKPAVALRAAQLLSEHGSSNNAALTAFRPVFLARRDHVGALVAVEELYARSSDAAGLAATYERIVSIVDDREAQRGALAELERARRLSGVSVGPVARQVLALDPDDPDALTTLSRQAASDGDLETELAMQARLARVSASGSLKAHHHQRVGEALLLKRDPSALASFRAALSEDGRSLGAARGLTLAARLARDPAALVEAARHEVHVTRDRPVAVAALLLAARLSYDRDAEDAAASAYEEALRLDPDHPEAATGLMMTMMHSAAVPRLSELLMQAAHAAQDAGRQCVLHLSVAQLSADLRFDLPAAIAATRRAVAARPGFHHPQAQLATYLERNHQFSEAASVIDGSLAIASGRALVESHLRLASLAERHLDDPERAMESLRAVLAQDDSEPAALTSLVRLERLRGNDAEALAFAKRLFSVVEDDVLQADALAEVAELERARGQIEAAATAAHSAVTIQGPLGAAARLYRGLITQSPAHATWEIYGQGLLAYLERAKQQRGGAIAATYGELARVFTEAQDNPQRATAVLREGAHVCPHDASISLALVRALRRQGDDEAAIEEVRRLLSVDVLEVGAWRALAETIPRLGEPDGAARVLEPLVVLGQATDEEERVARGRRVRAGRAPAGILTEGGLKRLMSSSALEEGAAAYVAGLAEVITKLEGIDYERWGVSKRDRIRAGEPHALRAFADRVGRTFGVPEFDMFVVPPSVVSRTLIVSGSPPALLVPASLEQEKDSVLAFHLARPLALLSRQLHPLDHVDDPTLERILVAAVRQLDPTFTLDPYMDDEELEAEVRRVGKAIGFFSRGRIQDATTAFLRNPTRNYPQWTREIRRLVARAALLVSDDLISTLETIGEELGPDNYATDLARFWVSDTAFRFRRAIRQAQQHAGA